MPKVSKATAAHVEDVGIMEGRYGQLDEYTVGFEHFREDADSAPLFKGLPDDRCQSPHWGYVFSGRVTFRYADHEETESAFDWYFAGKKKLKGVKEAVPLFRAREKDEAE